MSKSSKPQSKASTATAPAKYNSLRQQTAKRNRQQRTLVMVGAGISVVLIAAVIALNILRSQPVAGEQLPTQGTYHMVDGGVSPVTYNSTPPTSGPHYEGIGNWQIYSEAQRYETMLHNLEDGGVVVYYQCEDGCPEMVKQLEEIVDPYVKAGLKVVMTPNDPTFTAGTTKPVHYDMKAKIALTAWQKLLTLDTVDSAAIRSFIDRYQGIDHHGG